MNEVSKALNMNKDTSFGSFGKPPSISEVSQEPSAVLKVGKKQSSISNLKRMATPSDFLINSSNTQ